MPMKELLSHGNVLQIKENDVEKSYVRVEQFVVDKISKKEGDYLILDVPQDRSADVSWRWPKRGSWF